MNKGKQWVRVCQSSGLGLGLEVGTKGYIDGYLMDDKTPRAVIVIGNIIKAIRLDHILLCDESYIPSIVEIEGLKFEKGDIVNICSDRDSKNGYSGFIIETIFDRFKVVESIPYESTHGDINNIHLRNKERVTKYRKLVGLDD